MSTLKYGILGVLAVGALAVTPRLADAATNRTQTWCQQKPTSDTIITNGSSSNLIWKTNGELILQPTIHLVSKIWSSGTADQGDKLCWEASGTFAIYDAAGAKLWSQGSGSVSTSGVSSYTISPQLSECTLSATYSVTLAAIPPFIPSRTINGLTLWSKPGLCPATEGAVVGAEWCMDNTQEQVVLHGDWSELVWKPSGFLALLGTGIAAGVPIWQMPTAGAGAKLCFQSDGELAIYDAANTSIWHTNAASATSGYMLGLKDCALQVRPLDGSAVPWTSAFRCPQTQMPQREVVVGPSDIVLAENNDAKLVFDRSGNLVLRSVSGDEYWTTALPPNRGYRLAFQVDGNLVIYNSAHAPVWAANVQGGNLLVLDGCAFSLVNGSSVKWSRGSQSCAKTSLVNGWSIPASGNLTLLRTEESRLVWQWDGNLVLYSAGGSPLWASNTGRSGRTLSFQGDGNLVVYGDSGPLWASGTNVSGTVSYALKLGDNCTLTIADGSTTRWTGNSSCAVVNYTYSKTDGNSVFGSSMTTTLVAQNSGTARVDSTTAIDVTIFGTSHELFSATTYQTQSDNGSDLGNVALTIFGESAVGVNVSYEQTFFEIEETFTVGIVPVSVSAGASGELSLGLSYSGGTLTATPSAGISATVQAGVGAENSAAGASAGIRGSLTLLDISLPIAMKVYVENQVAKYAVSGSLDITSLSGALELYAEAYVKVFGVKIGVDWSKTIFSWNGVSWNKSLFSKSGSF